MKKIHYAWIICAIGMLMCVCNIGLSSNILSVYLPYIEQNGITGSQGSLIISIRCISTFFGTFFVTKYYKLFSLRVGLGLSTLMSALGIAIFAFADNRISIYYLGAIVLGMSYAFGSMVGVSILLKEWFLSSKGTALGICSMGTGFATILFAPFITSNTQRYGLTSTCLSQSAFVLVCAALAFLLIRDNPKDVGTDMYNVPEKKTVKTQRMREYSNNNQFDIPPSAWFQMLSMLFLMGGAGQVCSSHLSIAVSAAGYTKTVCGLCTTIYGAFLIIGKLIYGPIADRIGALKSTIIFMMLFYFGCAMTLALNGNSMIPIYLFPATLGLGCPFFTIGNPLWAEDLSPAGVYEKTLKRFQLMYSAGGIIVTMIPGMIADITGEYKSSYLIIGVMLFISMLLLINLYKERKSYYKKV